MRKTNLKILILEDDEALAQALSHSLGKRDHQVTCKSNLQEFLSMLHESNNHDLILMDLKLEHESSLQYIHEVRKKCPKATIYIITGYASIATTVEAIKQGADDYLPKPITADVILNNYFGKSEKSNIDERRLSPKMMEWELIQKTLNDNNGNISQTAKDLGMHRRTLQRKLQKRQPTGRA